VSDVGTNELARWLEELEARHLRDLSFAEVRRGLQALSSLYVERRGRAPLADAFRGAGKRAAYALFYGPLHFLTIRRIVRALGGASPPPTTILDLGCGTGAAGAAWAIEAGGRPEVLGVDRADWAVRETSLTLRALGLRGRARRADLDRTRLPARGGAVVAAYTANEAEPAVRDALLACLLEAAGGGASVLVVEPVSRRAAPWWESWSAAVVAAGGRDDTWKFPGELPERLRRLDRAAGLDHRELSARSLWLRGGASRRPFRASSLVSR
jgi:SAM-dependent methyltransferase